MKKILILSSLLIFAFMFMFTGCNNAAEPDEQIPYVPHTPEEVIPAAEEYVYQPGYEDITEAEIYIGTGYEAPPEQPPEQDRRPDSGEQRRLPALRGGAELPRLHGGTLYEIVSPENLTRFQYNSRYTFEQFFLPSVIFEMEDDVIHMLQTGDLRGMSELVSEVWELQTQMYIPEDEMIAMVGELPDAIDLMLDAVDAGVDPMQILEDLFHEITYIGDGHVVDITFEELDEFTNAFIIEMKDVEAGWLCTFIGIAYNDLNGLFMFTLERAHVPAGVEPFYVFCILHINFRGSFFPIENTREAFARYIGYAMDGALGNPGHTTERELWDLRAVFG